jgi:hypothetical protein
MEKRCNEFLPQSKLMKLLKNQRNLPILKK